MFLAELGSIVEGLEVAHDGASLAAAVHVLDRLHAKVAAALGAFDAEGLHDLDGDVTTVAWLKHQTGMDQTEAQRVTTRAKRLHALPVLRDALVSGRVTCWQVNTILAFVPNRHLERFAEHEAALVPHLEGLDPDRLRVAMVDWRHKADALDDAELVEHDNEVHLSRTIHDRGELRGSFDADLHATVAKALALADSGDKEQSLAVRQADALGTVCGFFLDHHTGQHGPRNRPHINLTMSYEDWAARTFDNARYTETGADASAVEASMLACDARYHRVVLGGSAVLDCGRAQRDWSTEQFNAILVRDGSCRWPGCDRPGSWCDVHHLHWWEAGGETAISNGALLCRRHHRKLHSKQGWEAKLLPDGTLEVTRPDGTTEQSTPRTQIDRDLWPPGQGRAA